MERNSKYFGCCCCCCCCTVFFNNCVANSIPDSIPWALLEERTSRAKDRDIRNKNRVNCQYLQSFSPI